MSKTSPRFESHNVIGWAPSVGYLVTLIGSVTVAAVGCHDRTTSAEISSANPGPSAYQPAVVTAAAREVLAASAATQAQTASERASNAAPPVASTTAVAPTTPTEPALEPATLVVKRFIVTPGVERREPLPTGETLTLGQPVYAFAELSSGKGGDGEVEIVFEHESGRQAGHINLAVPADKARWRTWGHSRGVTKPGRWAAVLLGNDHTELARVAFEVASPTPAAEPAAAKAPSAQAPEAAAVTPNAIVSAQQVLGG